MITAKTKGIKALGSKICEADVGEKTEGRD